jgi:hypothetical protein
MTDTAADIQTYIYNTVTELIAGFALADLSCILIYSNWEEEYIKAIKLDIKNHQVSESYQIPGIYKLHLETVEYVQLILVTNGISIDDENIETVSICSQGKIAGNRILYCIFEVKSVLKGFQYYLTCISKYSEKGKLFVRP